ncbi:hypothetical protein JKP10_00015 [Vibrio vulnificus]|uniref:DUF7668 domain-containing protein n=1 Tax=Vibrio vulnificus TaxID=672 RepID=UPI001CDD0D73|nr:hypothetical protein [Vibrio vulnificus]EJR3609132.1 hypothetical protein [Vibrio vulnificus]ELV8604621.1 hypothetical protein [Vibrio vulnificus]ELV8660723.1 hypothetical protein [Vibrio vulnificus]ELV8748736.1 hypothetical protein [Vibrio vulnificus]ELV8793053.1 hypothetical protein [Vibrio vulnificus]
MSQKIKVEKDENNQIGIPTVWRPTLELIVEALKAGDYTLSKVGEGVEILSSEDAEMVACSIEAYGATLVSLLDETWNTSACQWMGEYWDICVDLCTEDEGVSDLALFVRIYEESDHYIFRVQSVYVP